MGGRFSPVAIMAISSTSFSTLLVSLRILFRAIFVSRRILHEQVHQLWRNSTVSRRDDRETTSAHCPSRSGNPSAPCSRRRPQRLWTSCPKRWYVSPARLASTARMLNRITQTFDPKKRLTVDQALEHPYLAAYVSPLRSPGKCTR